MFGRERTETVHFLQTFCFFPDVCLKSFKEENPFPHQHRGPRFLKCLAPPLMAAVITLSSPVLSTPGSRSQPHILFIYFSSIA